jgi:hypothetical protein
LTDDEKKMSMDQLLRKWKLERQRRMQEREELKMSDFEPLGDLTEEQKLLPRPAVARIIHARKNEVWAQGMKALGHTLQKCDVCSRLHLGEHRCLATRWRTEGPKGTATARNIILTQSPQGVRLRATSVVDEDQVLKEYERLKTLKEEIETRKRLVEPNVPTGSQDTPMAAIAASSSSSLPHNPLV